MEIDLRNLEFDQYLMDYNISTMDDVLFTNNLSIDSSFYQVRISLTDAGQKADEGLDYDYVVITYLDNERIIKQVIYDIEDFEYETYGGESVIKEYFDYKTLKKCVEDYL